MKVTTKGRYGLRSIVDLAMHSKEGPVALSSIASRQGVSVNYLEQAFALLRKAGVIESIKGAQGGYKLARNPEAITVLEVLEILEGKLSILPVDGEETLLSQYVREMVWDKVDDAMHTFMNQITLKDLMIEAVKPNKCEDLIFYI